MIRVYAGPAKSGRNVVGGKMKYNIVMFFAWTVFWLIMAISVNVTGTLIALLGIQYSLNNRE